MKLIITLSPSILSFCLPIVQALPSSFIEARDVATTIADRYPATIEDREARIPVDDGPSVPACWTSLSCSFHVIEDMSLPTRLSYVQYMETRFISLNAGNQFRAIEGVIEFFISVDVGGQGTWVSYVDAGIVEAIQRGGAIALGIGTATGGNPGTSLWAEFLTKMKNNELGNRNVLIFFLSFLPFAR